MRIIMRNNHYNNENNTRDNDNDDHDSSRNDDIGFNKMVVITISMVILMIMI